MKKIDSVIFDFDGVIIDSEKKKFQDITNILKKYNISLNQNIFKNFVGKKRGFFLKENTNLDEKYIRSILKEIRSLDKEINKLILVNNVKVFIEFLYKKNIKMFIVTGSSLNFVKEVLRHFKLIKYFENIISGEEFNESKPSPQCYLLAKQKFELGNTLVIEDSFAGVKSAKNANLKVIGLGTYFDELDADYQYKDFKDIMKLLK